MQNRMYFWIAVSSLPYMTDCFSADHSLSSLIKIEIRKELNGTAKLIAIAVLPEEDSETFGMPGSFLLRFFAAIHLCCKF